MNGKLIKKEIGILLRNPLVYLGMYSGESVPIGTFMIIFRSTEQKRRIQRMET